MKKVYDCCHWTLMDSNESEVLGDLSFRNFIVNRNRGEEPKSTLRCFKRNMSNIEATFFKMKKLMYGDHD